MKLPCAWGGDLSPCYMSGPAFWRQVNLNIYLNFQHIFLDLTISGERPYIWFFSFSPSQRPNCNGQAPFLTSRGIDHFPDLLWGGGNRPVVLVGIPFYGPGGNTIWGSWWEYHSVVPVLMQILTPALVLGPNKPHFWVCGCQAPWLAGLSHWPLRHHHLHPLSGFSFLFS